MQVLTETQKLLYAEDALQYRDTSGAHARSLREKHMRLRQAGRGQTLSQIAFSVWRWRASWKLLVQADLQPSPSRHMLIVILKSLGLQFLP